MNKKVKQIIDFCNDLIDIFTDYSFSLDKYFSIEKNRQEHLDLYNEYINLNQNLNNVIIKNGFDKR